MNLRELEYVVAIGHHLNFSKAAAACHVSQPALSNQIKKLEGELGLPLFSRGNSEIQPTPLGRKVIESAKRIMMEAREIQDLATEHRDPVALPFRIGLDPTLAPYLMCYLRTAVADQLPELKVSIVEDKAESLAGRVAARDIDVALLPQNSYQNPLDFTALFDENLFLVVARENVLATMDQISLYDIPFDQLIRLSQPLYFTSEAGIYPSQETRGSNKHHGVETSSFDTMCRHIRDCGGCSIVPALAARQLQAEGCSLAFVPIRESSEKRRVGVISRVGCPRKPLLEALVQHIHANLPAGAEPTLESGDGSLNSNGQDPHLVLLQPHRDQPPCGAARIS